MKAKFTRIDIYDPEKDGPQFLSGFIRDKPFERIHDVVGANILALEDKNLKAVLIVIDACYLDGHWQDKLRKILREQGIHSIISVTHTHGAPSMVHSPTLGRVDEEYLKQVMTRVLADVRLAFENMEKVFEIKVYQEAMMENIIMRRTHITDYPNPGYLHKMMSDHTPGIVLRDVGNLNLLEINTTHNLPIVMSNLGCHPNVIKGEPQWHQMTRDYPGALSDYIERYYYSFSLFTQGASGDIRPAMLKGDFEALEAFSVTLGAKATNLLLRDKPFVYSYGKDLKLRFEEVTLSIPYSQTPDFTVAMSALKIGASILITAPGELYSSLARTIEGMFKNKAIIIGCANGTIGYIPDEEDFRVNHKNGTPLASWTTVPYFIPGYGNPGGRPNSDIGEIIVSGARKLLEMA
ncbi:MAG: hypothetical protein AAB545_00290 [Patescibacteria group bacterium]